MGHDMKVVSGRVQQHAHRLISNRFVQNVATVATGIAAAQAISFAFMPFLTRLYSPAAFGALAAFTAVLNIITPLGTLGYSSAIVMPESEEDAAAVARLSLMCGALVAPMALVGIFLFQTQLASWTGLEVAPGLLYLIPFSLLLSAVLSVANQAAIREGLFKAPASSRACWFRREPRNFIGRGGLIAMVPKSAFHRMAIVCGSILLRKQRGHGRDLRLSRLAPLAPPCFSK